MFFKPNITKMKEKRNLTGLVKVLGDERKISQKKIEELEIKALTELNNQQIKDKETYGELADKIMTEFSDQRMTYGERAAKALIELNDQTIVPELIKVVENAPDGFMTLGKSNRKKLHAAINAINILGNLGDKRAIPVLQKSLSKSLVIGDHPAQAAIRRLGGATDESIVQQLNSPDVSKRRIAIETIVSQEEKNLIPNLVKLLDDIELQGYVIQALGNLGDTSALNKILQIGVEGDLKTSRNVLVYLLNVGEKSQQGYSIALKTLRQDVDGGLGTRDKTYSVQYLCNVDIDKDAIPLLIQCLRHLADSSVKWHMSMTLGTSVESTISWPNPFQDCIRAITKSGDSKHIPLLKIQRQEMLKYNPKPTNEIQLLDETISNLSKKRS